jgi:hypothetical protein
LAKEHKIRPGAQPHNPVEQEFMKLQTWFLASLLMVAINGHAQSSTNDPARLYTLLRGSELTEDCPVCDRVSIPMPMTGTFRMRFLDADPLYTRYAVEQVAFRATSQSGQEYQVTGHGTYQVGGHLVVLQDLFLDLEITNGISTTRALCVNEERTGGLPWPEIRINVSQTNGTLAQVYRLTLVDAPGLEFVSVQADRQTGDVRLTWAEHGRQAQVEWATNVAGPYSPLSSITSDLSYTHLGILTNRSQTFYRLRQH